MNKIYRLLLIVSLFSMMVGCASETPAPELAQPSIIPIFNQEAGAGSTPTPSPFVQSLATEQATSFPSYTPTFTPTLTSTLTTTAVLLSTPGVGLVTPVVFNQSPTPIPPTEKAGGSQILREKHGNDPCT